MSLIATIRAFLDENDPRGEPSPFLRSGTQRKDPSTARHVWVHAKPRDQIYAAILAQIDDDGWTLRETTDGNLSSSVSAYRDGEKVHVHVTSKGKSSWVAAEYAKVPRWKTLSKIAKKDAAAAAKALLANKTKDNEVDVLLGGELLARHGHPGAKFDDLAVAIQRAWGTNLIVEAYVRALPDGAREKLVRRLFEKVDGLFELDLAPLAPTDAIVENFVLPRLVEGLADWSSKDKVYNAWYARRMAELLAGRGRDVLARTRPSKLGGSVLNQILGT